MEAEKYTVKVEIEVLDLDSVGELLRQTCGLWNLGNQSAKVAKCDGDSILLYIDAKDIKC